MKNALNKRKEFLKEQLKKKSDLERKESGKDDKRLKEDFNWEGYF